MDAHHHLAVPGLTAPEPAHCQFFDLAPPHTGAADAVVAPISGRASNPANVEGVIHTKADHVILSQATYTNKQFATLRAQLALKGYCLSRTDIDDGPVRFYVGRWGMVRELRDIAAVRAFTEQVGATNA